MTDIFTSQNTNLSSWDNFEKWEGLSQGGWDCRDM
jgi:hypothetical protein